MVVGPVAMSANRAHSGSGFVFEFLRQVIGGLLEVRFGSQTLCRLHCRGHSLRIGFGLPPFRLQTAEKFVDMGGTSGVRLRRRHPMFERFLVFVYH